MGLRLVPVVLLWVSVVKRWPTLRQGAPQRALWLTLATCAVAATLDLPAVAPWLDRLTGAGPNLVHLVKHSAALVGAAAAREVVRGFAMPPERAAHHGRRRMAVLAGAVAALCALFALAPINGTAQPGLTARYATEPLMLAYWAVFLTFLAAALLSIGRLTRWYLLHAPPSALRTGLLAIGAGAGAGLLYVAHKVLYLVARLGGVTTGPVVETMETVSSVLLGLSIVLLVAGVSWPALAQHPLLRRAAAYRAYRVLQPLWSDLTEAMPAVALAPPGRDIESSLYNRIVEIRDGELALRPYAPPQLASRIREVARDLHVPSRHLEAATEAAWLEVTRRSKTRGIPPIGDNVLEPRGGADFDDEVRALIDVARRRQVGARIADRIDLAHETQDDEAHDRPAPEHRPA